LLATAAIVSCHKSNETVAADSGLDGPTDLVVTWTLAGMPAQAQSCMMIGAAQVAIDVSGTIDPSLHQSATLDCAAGTTTFPRLLVEKLGTPYVEGTLLDGKGVTVIDAMYNMPLIVGATVTPQIGTTTVKLDFDAWREPSGAASSSGSSSTSTSTSSSSATGGTGGVATASSSSGGTGGVVGASSSSTGSSSTSGSTSSGASSSGIQDAGDGG
jgi:hypothetical protein